MIALATEQFIMRLSKGAHRVADGAHRITVQNQDVGTVIKRRADEFEFLHGTIQAVPVCLAPNAPVDVLADTMVQAPKRKKELKKVDDSEPASKDQTKLRLGKNALVEEDDADLGYVDVDDEEEDAIIAEAEAKDIEMTTEPVGPGTRGVRGESAESNDDRVV